MSDRFVLGVTGGIATGKSAVLAILAESGFDTIDADLVYHQLIEPSGDLVQPLADRFGGGIVAGDGSIDRGALGRIVFSDPSALVELDRITHPAVIEAVRDRIERSDSEWIAVDAVKLIESGMTRLCDVVWLVVATPELQRSRLMSRNGLTPDEANRRLAAQPDEAVRRTIANQVIDNTGSYADLRRKVTTALAESLPKG